MPTPSLAIMRSLISFHRVVAFAFSLIAASRVRTNGRLQHRCFMALKLSIISELINAILFLRAKRLPEQITQPSASPPNPCATAFCRKTTGMYGSCTRNYRVEAILLSLSTHFSSDAQEVLSPLCARDGCSEKEEECFT